MDQQDYCCDYNRSDFFPAEEIFHLKLKVLTCSPSKKSLKWIVAPVCKISMLYFAGPSSPSTTSSLSSLSKEEILPPSPAPSLAGAQPTVPIVTPPGDREEDLGAAGSSQDTDKHGEKDGKKKKNRCLSCKKKVGLTGFTCRCGGLFCSIHRYSDKHQCDFDYKVKPQTPTERDLGFLKVSPPRHRCNFFTQTVTKNHCQTRLLLCIEMIQIFYVVGSLFYISFQQNPLISFTEY